MKYLNLGCGDRFSPEWTNIDFVSSSPYVQAHNLLKGIPFVENTFDVVYHSHVLEHFKKSDALQFIKESYRVLKPGGIIRVVVPNLEDIVRLYLDRLEKSRNGDLKAKADYDWMMLELYDQVARNTSGGEMVSYWSKTPSNEEFIISRHGNEYLHFRDHLKSNVGSNKGVPFANLKIFNWRAYRNKLLLILSGQKRLLEYLQIGRFRSEGEIHQWMYDEFSLGELLRTAGFSKVTRTSAFKSGIREWSKYNFLDVEGDKVRKPDSLFMEAVR